MLQLSFMNELYVSIVNSPCTTVARTSLPFHLDSIVNYYFYINLVDALKAAKTASVINFQFASFSKHFDLYRPKPFDCGAILCALTSHSDVSPKNRGLRHPMWNLLLHFPSTYTPAPLLGYIVLKLKLRFSSFVQHHSIMNYVHSVIMQI